MSDSGHRGRAGERVRRLAVVGGLLFTAGCTLSTAPEDRVEMTLQATPTTLTLGDTVHLLGIAHNPTSTEIVPESGCAPGIGFYVRDQSGVEMSLYAGLVFTCQGRDSQLIAPGETDSVRFRWVPEERGSYQVRAALVFEQPRSSSSATPVTVR